MVSLLCKTETLCSTDIVGGGPKKSEGMGGECEEGRRYLFRGESDGEMDGTV